MLKIDNYPNIRAIHVIKDNQLIYKQLREDTSDTQLFPVGCIFKSILSVLVGIAIQEKKINSIEDCILDYVSHEDVQETNWYKVKIKHALSKTTGIVWPGPQEPIPANIGEIMQLRFGSKPGVAFQYKPDPQIIVYLLEEVYGMEITKLFAEKILPYFESNNYQWDRDRIEDLQVSIQFLDEWGQLLLNMGVVGETRLFSEEYYQQCLSEHSGGGFPECTAYGLGVWIEKRSDFPYFYASGFGGQYLVVIPQKNMTISILSDMDRPHPENKEIIEKTLQL